MTTLELKYTVDENNEKTYAETGGEEDEYDNDKYDDDDDNDDDDDDDEEEEEEDEVVEIEETFIYRYMWGIIFYLNGHISTI